MRMVSSSSGSAISAGGKQRRAGRGRGNSTAGRFPAILDDAVVGELAGDMSDDDAGVPDVRLTVPKEPGLKRYDAFTATQLPALDWQVRPDRARPLFEWAVANDLFVLLNPGSPLSKDFPPFELNDVLHGRWI